MSFSFKRIVSSGNFIPEIDGLRFVAIVSVLIFHLQTFIYQKDTHTYLTTFSADWLTELCRRGHYGVPLFFIISGFILGRPFAAHYLSGGRAIRLKAYFTKRLTRLEPPYILVMTLLLFGAVFIAKTLPVSEAIKSYLASIFYVHNFIYGEEVMPKLNTVAWSLEVEVQFYLLAPLAALVFTLDNRTLRRSLLIVAAMGFIVFDNLVNLPFISILDYAEYFIVGFLLADLYVIEDYEEQCTPVWTAVALAAFAGIWAFNTEASQTPIGKTGLEIIQLASMFFFFYAVVFKKAISFFANTVVTSIGGMCYTIYLIHYALISAVGNPLLRVQFFDLQLLNTMMYVLILTGVVMLCSAVFFLLVERPCMDKHWYRKLLPAKK